MRIGVVTIAAVGLCASVALAGHYEMDLAWKGHTDIYNPPSSHNPQWLAAHGTELGTPTKEKMYDYNDGQVFNYQHSAWQEFTYLMALWDYEDVAQTIARAYAWYDYSSAVDIYVWDNDLNGGDGGWWPLGGVYRGQLNYYDVSDYWGELYLIILIVSTDYDLQCGWFHCDVLDIQTRP